MRSIQAAKLTFSAFVLTTAVAASEGRAESVLNFPRLSSRPGTITGAAFINPTGESADLTVTAYGEDGGPLAGEGITNPAVLTVSAGQQLALVTSDPRLFGPNLDPSTVAWFQGVSSTNDLTGFFLFLDEATTIFDGADLPPVGRKIVFNQVRIDEGRTTELNIINPEVDPTGIDLLLISGEDVIEANPDGIDFTIPARGVARLDAAEFFQIDSLEPGAYILALSDTNIGGFQFIRSPDGDLLGLNARCLDEQLTDIYFPQLAVLGPWLMEIGVANYAPQPIALIISAHQPDGTLYEAPVVERNRVVRNLGSGLSLRENVQTLFGFSGPEPLDGWVKVEATDESINGYVTYGVPAVGSIAAVTAPVRALRRAVFSHIATTLDFFTGVAALNPSSLAANLRILALRPSGEILGRFDAVLSPGERISGVLSEIIPEAAGQAGGIIWVSSDRPLYLTSLFGTVTGSVLANIPPQPVPVDYRPDAGLPAPTVAPTFVVARLNEAFQFEALGGLENPAWSLDGDNGDAAGSIDSSGLYQAPAAAPPSLPVTVLAEADSFAAAATVDVLAPQTLRDNLEVGPLAYLPVQRRLYGVQTDGSDGSRLLEISENSAVEIASFPGEEISAIAAFADFRGDESLLLAGRTGGSVIRYDTVRRQTRTVVGGFDRPSALALDPVTGNLLVADSGGLTLVSRAQLESDVVSGVEQNGALPRRLIETSGIGGIAVDGCTGEIFYSHTASGELRSYDPVSGAIAVAAEGFQSPDFLLALQRADAPCGGSSFHLLAAERNAELFSMTALADGVINDWLAAPGSGGAALLPESNPFSEAEALVIARGASHGAAAAPVGAAAAALTLAPTPGLYRERAVNPLDARPVGSVADPPNDTFLFGAEAFDIVELSAVASGSAIDVLISFVNTPDPGIGFIEIDLDSDPQTGTTSSTDFNTPYSTGMGIDLCIDLCIAADGGICDFTSGSVMASVFRWSEEEAEYEFVDFVPATFESRSVSVSVPFALLEGANPIRLSAAFGPLPGAAEAVPNGGFLISGESGPVVAGGDGQTQAPSAVEAAPAGEARPRPPAAPNRSWSRRGPFRLP